MRVAEVNDVRLHYREDGDPAGPPVVFGNSLGTDLRIWDRVVARLPRGLRLIRYDTRGHGLSDAPVGDYYMGDLVGDAAGLIEQLGARGAVFIGLSIGGVIGQGLAAERPDLLRGLVLSNTAAKIGTEAIWRERMEAIRAGGIVAIADQVMERWFSRRFREEEPEMIAWRHMLTRAPVDGYLGCCAALADTDLRDSTAGLSLPVLAIGGSEDGSTPPDLVRETARSIAGARFELIRGAGHIPCVEAPEAVAALIEGFLGEVGHI